MFNVDIERDVLSRVRSVKTGFGNGPTKWQGFEYDNRHHFTVEHYADSIPTPGPSVGTHDLATNGSVQAAAAYLGASQSSRVREDAVGGILQILDGSTPQWQATNAGVLGRDIGHRLKDVAVDGATYPIGHDMRGRITTAPKIDITYDVHNRLVSAEKNADWEVYLYDGNGVMVARQDSTGDFEQFAWDGNQMIGSYETLGSARWEAVFGAGQDELLAFYDYQNGKDLLPVRDWRNNIVSAFDTSSETMMGSASYTAEGRVTTYDNTGSTLCFEEGSGSVCPMPGGLPFAFNGQWRSSLTGLSYMRNRWYSPRLGQFINHDPLHYVDSVNLYSFAGFDPINSWDPLGLQRWSQLHGEFSSGGMGSSDPEFRLTIALAELEEIGIDISRFQSVRTHISVLQAPDWFLDFHEASAMYYPNASTLVMDSGSTSSSLIHEMIHAVVDFDESGNWDEMEESLDEFHAGDPIAGAELNQEIMTGYGEPKTMSWMVLVASLKGPVDPSLGLMVYRNSREKTNKGPIGTKGTDDAKPVRKGMPKKAKRYVDQDIFNGSMPDEPLESAFVRSLIGERSVRKLDYQTEMNRDTSAPAKPAKPSSSGDSKPTGGSLAN